MMYVVPPLRPGMTAIAAVIALSATPLFAQNIEPLPQPVGEPVVVTPPPAPSVATVAPIDPVLQQPVTAQTAPAQPDLSRVTAPPAATPAITPEPSAPSVARSADAPKPVAKAASPAAAAPRAVEPKPEPVAQTPAPEAAPVPPVMARAPAPIPAPAPAPVARVAPPENDIAPVAGAAGAALLAAAGIGYALSRRRRRVDERGGAMVVPVRREPLTPEGIPPAQPVRPGPAMAAPGLPAGFDVSRYGPHVQAAYRGPTPDNPSRSLKRRLKRARFFDQRARMGMALPAVMAEPAAQPAAEPVAPQPTQRPAPRPIRWNSGGFRPVFQN